MWSSIVKKDAPSKPPTTERAPARVVGMVGDCKSTEGISVAVVDANAVIEGGQSLTNFADKFVTVPEVFKEIRDPTSRRRLDLIPFTIETMEPSPESLSKVNKFAYLTGDLRDLSIIDRKLIALTYTLEAQVHGTKHLRDVPPPIQFVRLRRLPEQELPSWGSNVDNVEEWEALENKTDENSNSNTNSNSKSKILPLKDLNMNILPSDKCSEDEQEGESKQKQYPPKKTEVKLEGKMVVEGIDASRGEYDDGEDAGDWRPAVSSSTHRKFLRRKAKREHYDALAEQEIQRDLQADKPAFMALHEGPEDTNAEASLSNGEDSMEVEAAGTHVPTFEASSMADDGSSEQSWSLRTLSESSVACITGDFAMQNVILPMGLRLLAPGGKQIRQLNRWILRCHACHRVTRENGRIFCPKCGNCLTLLKEAVTIGANGTILAARNPRRINTQGTKFPIPMPKSGRDSITKNLVLREDQLPQKYLHPKTKKKASKPGDDFFISDDVFMNHYNDRKAPLQPPLGKTMAIFSQKRNPNDNHYSRSMH